MTNEWCALHIDMPRLSSRNPAPYALHILTHFIAKYFLLRLSANPEFFWTDLTSCVNCFELKKYRVIKGGQVPHRDREKIRTKNRSFSSAWEFLGKSINQSFDGILHGLWPLRGNAAGPWRMRLQDPLSHSGKGHSRGHGGPWRVGRGADRIGQNIGLCRARVGGAAPGEMVQYFRVGSTDYHSHAGIGAANLWCLQKSRKAP